MNIAVVLYSSVIIAGFIGWIMNIIDICQASDTTGFIVVRVIGIFVVPLGAILGWF